MDRITRKELKSDKFALEVEHTVEYVAEHRRQLIRYGIAAGVVAAAVLAFFIYTRQQHSARQRTLAEALEIQQAPIAVAPNEGIRTFPSAAERDKAAIKAFTEVTANYSGSDEAIIAEYYLGTIAASQGNVAAAEKQLREVADSSNKNYASLARLSLAEVLKTEGKLSEGEQVLRALIANPTEFVSKEQATIALAQLVASTKPAEARKLLEPLRIDRSAVSRTAIALLSELPK